MMNKVLFRWSYLILAIVIAACNSGTKADDGTRQQVAVTQPQTPGALQSISPAAMQDLWQNCNALDIIFYETNFSLSQDDQNAIRGTLGFFSPDPVQRDPNCKPMGRLTFLVDGNIRQEADIYLSETCKYFVWFRNNTPVCINGMTTQGATFFNQILQQGRDMQ